MTIVSILFIQGSMILPVAQAASPFKCEDLNPPDPPTSAPSKTQGWIISILEENIGSPSGSSAVNGDNTSAGNQMTCFRENTTTPSTTSDGKPGPSTTSSLYKSTCTISPSGTVPAVSCQRVQVFFAQSGAQLLYTYVGQIYIWASATVGIVAVFYLVYGGIQISTAQGDSGRIEKAKEKIMQSLGGLVLLFLSALILYTINPNFFTLS